MQRPPPEDFALKETKPHLGGGRISGDKLTSTYDLVEQMQYLYVRVVKAKDLPTKDVTGSCDPYVEVKLGNYKGATRHFEKKSNPEWNQVFAFSKDRIQATVLEVIVKDKDLMKDDFMGRVSFDLNEVPKRVPPDSPLAPQWYRLEDHKGNKARGELMLAVWMGTQADEAFPEAWHSDAATISGADSLANIRSKVYLSPKLWYLRVNVIEAQDLIPSDKGRYPEVYVKAILGNQALRTRISPSRSINPMWNEDLMFVASEPFEEPLILSVEDRIAPNKDEILGRCAIPLQYVPRRYDHKPVNTSWHNLEKHVIVEGEKKKEIKFASRIHMRICLEGGYHVLDESTHYSSDLRPTAKPLWKSSIGILEVGILNAQGLMPMKTKDGRGTTDAYCVAKYGQKWVRTRTIIDSFMPRWNEQYTWEVFDPCTVITIGVFDNCHLHGGEKAGGAKDARIGKVRIRLSTLETDRVYTHSYPLLVLHPNGVKKMGEIHMAVRFTCSSLLNMMHMYSQPLLPKMHYIHPLTVSQLDSLRHQATQIVSIRLSRAEPPLRKEVVEYMLDVGSHMWSMRRSKANFFRIMNVFGGIIAVGKWFDQICNWKNPITTVLIHILFIILVMYPELILPTIFLYLFLIGVWYYRWRPRHPPHMDTRLSHADSAHPDELDEEFDTFPTSRPSDIVRMRYDRLRSIAGRIQTVVGDLATQGERLQSLLSWRVAMLQSLDDGIAAFRQRKSRIVANPHCGISEIDGSLGENGEYKLVVGHFSNAVVNDEEAGGMSGNGGIRLSDNLTNVPLEVDNSYRSNAQQGLIGVPKLDFSVDEEEDGGTSVDRRVQRRGRPSGGATCSGSVHAGVTKLSSVSNPFPISVGNAFPNSNLSQNEEEVGIKLNQEDVGLSIDRRVRRRGRPSKAATGSVNAVMKLSNASPPVPIALGNAFPNSNLLENEDVGISNTNVSVKKRVRDENAFGAANDGTIGNDYEVKRLSIEQIHMAIGRFLYEIQAPLDAVKNSVYFQPMIDAIASGGKETVAPSYDDIRGWMLKNAVEEMKSEIQQHKETWARTGCSLLVSQWNSEKGRTLLNFAVYSSEGTAYLKSVDASYFIFSPDALFAFFKEMVEEIGVVHVLQVITNTEEQFSVVGKKLMDTFPTLYWSPCSTACIDSILEDFGKVEWINSVIEQARSVTRFIYKHVVILNMMRRYTFGNDIVRLGVSRFATNFMTLKQMAGLKYNLQSMVTSNEWMGCPFSKTPEGSAVLDIFSNHSFWSSCILITRLTNPLLRVLRIVGSQKRPAMGYVFAGMYRAKETIKIELVKKEEYMVYWNIIDHRWKKLWDFPLHAAGFYLNPKFFYGFKGDMHNEIVSRMFDCIERLVPDIKVQDEVIKEINLYKNAVGDLGRNLAVRARDNLLPAEWWSTYGGGCPNLARLAIRILSQTCSLVPCQDHQIPFEQLHKTRNSVEHQRLNDLVFVQYNLKLKQKVHKHKEQEYADPISFDRNSIAEEWVAEMEMHQEDTENPDWMSLDPPSENSRLLELSVDEVEELGSGFDDNEILSGLKVVKEEC